MILAVVAVMTLVAALMRDRGSNVTKTLERIEADVKDLGTEVRKLGERVGAMETRMAVVEERLPRRDAPDYHGVEPPSAPAADPPGSGGDGRRTTAGDQLA